MGDAFTGNTTMLLEEGLDTGPILLQQTHEIRPDETATELFDELARAGAPLMVETLAGLAEGCLNPQPQNDELATFAPILNREDGRMDFAARTATELHNRWRGFQPWPGAFTAVDGKKLIVHRMTVTAEPASTASTLFEPGGISVQDHRFHVACAENTWLEFLEVQLEGKKRLPATEFLRGNPIHAGAKLG
jgi:methionyl-tRNA formyltransferase